MKIRTIILLKNREVEIKYVNPKHTHFKFREGLYILSEKGINNYTKDEILSGSEIIVFEGNPNPLTDEGLKDNSKDYLNEVTKINVMKQTSLGPKFSIGSLFEGFGWLKNPINWFWLFVVAMVGYGLITGGGF